MLILILLLCLDYHERMNHYIISNYLIKNLFNKPNNDHHYVILNDLIKQIINIHIFLTYFVYK